MPLGSHLEAAAVQELFTSRVPYIPLDLAREKVKALQALVQKEVRHGALGACHAIPHT